MDGNAADGVWGVLLKLLTLLRAPMMGSGPLYNSIPMLVIYILAFFCLVPLLCWLPGVVYRRVTKKDPAAFKQGLAGFLRGFTIVPLLALAALALGNYLDNFGHWRAGSFLNAYEFYHYYMGSKYAKETGYFELYSASLVADDDTGRLFTGANKQGRIRNLATGSYVPIKTVLDEREALKARFSEARWEEWKKDIRWFKKNLGKSRWEGVLCDKGYNGTPVWTALVGGLLSNNVSTDSELGMNLLAGIDPMLIAAAALCVAWAFGPPRRIADDHRAGHGVHEQILAHEGRLHAHRLRHEPRPSPRA